MKLQNSLITKQIIIILVNRNNLYLLDPLRKPLTSSPYLKLYENYNSLISQWDSKIIQNRKK